jgi:diadenosine tetraphosphate (Ap4A) HIT family hydrolase
MTATSPRETTSSEPGCPFCSIDKRVIVLQNQLAVVIKDIHPITKWHLLVIPKRHVASWFELEGAEVVACQELLVKARTMILGQDSEIGGFNIAINTGQAAGQTVMHAHIHLIARRSADHRDVRGGKHVFLPPV